MRLARYCFLFSALASLPCPPTRSGRCLMPATSPKPSMNSSSFSKCTRPQTRRGIKSSRRTTSLTTCPRCRRIMYQRYKAQFALWTNLNAPEHLRQHRRLDYCSEYRVSPNNHRLAMPLLSSRSILILRLVSGSSTRYSGDNRESIRDFRSWRRAPRPAP